MDLKPILLKAESDFNNAVSALNINEVKAKYLGKKSFLGELMQKMKDFTPEERKEYGKLANDFKVALEVLYEKALKRVNDMEIEKRLTENKLDITLPGLNFNQGTIHPLTKITREIEDLFLALGYEIKEGPEVEIDEYNFEKLNLPKNHPARDMHDSFYIDAHRLLRTHTSPVQVRTMLESQSNELKIICPGKTYRRDLDDATHSHQFMQIEGLVIGPNINMANLKGTLDLLAKTIFGQDREIRLRPSYFPFTEPSVELDVSCQCQKQGCPICKYTGFIEILGAGIVNKKVFAMCGLDPEKVQGFAFGLGVERIAMLKYKMNNLRHFYTNDLRFLKQFKGGL
ncbi:MAG: phenylalanine--tRNA ligase subunit alpha [Erysipelotrichales bacterium]|nr:phenylalanine--tRNA ligase subunit alpha [Erysipelotrichales bacterium]